MTARPGQWVHMVGIAGAGMSGIARVLTEEGYRVSGSDLQSNHITAKLSDLGVKIYQGHSSSNIREGVDLLVVSSAIPKDNPEILMALEQNIPILTRGQMLAVLVNRKKGIAVAGAHGKTTTTSMIYACLDNCGLDPTFIVGGELKGSGLNACIGSGPFSVVEADESDASFLALHPYIAVVTNIEDDHLDHYGSVENIRRAFKQFIEQVSPDGFAVLYGEDEYNQVIKSQAANRVLTYGEAASNDYYLSGWRPVGMGSQFELCRQGQNEGVFELSVPGKHNALNALAAIAVAIELGGEKADIKRAIKEFKGAGRRFEITGQKKGITVVDDYAHHPTEIEVTLRAARDVYAGRIIAVFQPHRYSRTKIKGVELGKSLQGADLVIVTDVYSAGETPIPGISGETVYNAAVKHGCNALYLPTLDAIERYLLQNVRENDLVMTMGAGDIWKTGVMLLEKL